MSAGSRLLNQLNLILNYNKYCLTLSWLANSSSLLTSCWILCSWPWRQSSTPGNRSGFGYLVRNPLGQPWCLIVGPMFTLPCVSLHDHVTPLRNLPSTLSLSFQLYWENITSQDCTEGHLSSPHPPGILLSAFLPIPPCTVFPTLLHCWVLAFQGLIPAPLQQVCFYSFHLK